VFTSALRGIYNQLIWSDHYGSISKTSRASIIGGALCLSQTPDNRFELTTTQTLHLTSF